MKNLIIFGLVALACDGVFASTQTPRPQDEKACDTYTATAEEGRKAEWNATEKKCKCTANKGWNKVQGKCYLTSENLNKKPKKPS